MACDDCAAAYGGDTPCERCEHAVNVPPAGREAWALWLACHQFGRDGSSGALQLGTLLRYAEARGATADDVELALEVEREVKPLQKGKG